MKKVSSTKLISTYTAKHSYKIHLISILTITYAYNQSIHVIYM
jgi:hypothetical protein